MKKLLFSSSNSYGPLFTRVALGGVIFAHGAQKLLGWFGGYGFDGSMNYFTQQRGLPWIVGFLVIIIEFFGAVAIVAGLATRIFAASIAGVMTAVIITTFNKHFFMNWFGSQPEEGYEFFLLAVGMSISLVITGAGAWSLDNLIARNQSSQHAGAKNNFKVAA